MANLLQKFKSYDKVTQYVIGGTGLYTVATGLGFFKPHESHAAPAKEVETVKSTPKSSSTTATPSKTTSESTTAVPAVTAPKKDTITGRLNTLEARMKKIESLLS